MRFVVGLLAGLAVGFAVTRKFAAHGETGDKLSGLAKETGA